MSITPATLAARTLPTKLILPKSDWVAIEKLLASIALSASGTGNLEGPEAVRFASLERRPVACSDLTRDWASALSMELSVTEAILFEAKFAAAAPFFGTHGMGGSFSSYLKTLHTARERAFIAIDRYARDMSTLRPEICVRALKIARNYCRHVVANIDITNQDKRNFFLGKLGVNTVLIGRFEPVDARDWTEARKALRRSIALGNSAREAYAYLLEAGAYAFDLEQDANQLQEDLHAARRALGASLGFDARALMSAAQAYMRLGVYATHDQVRRLCLNLASECVDGVTPEAVYEKISKAVLREIIGVIEERLGEVSPTYIKGLTIPFCARSDSHASVVADHTLRIARSLLPLVRLNEKMAWSIYADLLSIRLAKGNVEDMQDLVRARKAASISAVERGDMSSGVLNCRDRLLEAAIINDPARRQDAIVQTLEMHVRWPTSPAFVLLLAQDVDLYGPVKVEVKGSTEDRRVQRAVEQGVAEDLYAIAARLSVDAPDLIRENLGGRSNVETVGDYLGLLSEKFLFKNCLESDYEREQTRLLALQDHILRQANDARWSVAEYLCQIERSGNEILAVRRFSSGRPASRAISEMGLTDRVDLSIEIAQFLAFINLHEMPPQGTGRTDLKKKEVGRWLKAIGAPNWSELFNTWHRFLDGMPLYARRDAHLDNWVLSNDATLTAIDFEAVGVRPLGYELAQVTDDSVVFSPTDWSSRFVVLSHYCDMLGEPFTDAHRRAFQAAVAARCLRRATAPGERSSNVQHAIETLLHLAASALDEDLAQWCAEVCSLWYKMRGIVDNFEEGYAISDKRRHKISRRMAYLLRHSSSIDRSEGGWVSVGELAAAMELGGDERAVLWVASHPEEPRFEVEDGCIRARYGHSAGIESGVQNHATHGVIDLFHGTTFTSLRPIIEGGEGIRSMKREMVHLVADSERAVRTAVRHGYPQLLRVNSSSLVNVYQRDRETFVCKEVPARAVSITPLAVWQSLSPAITDF